MGAGVIRIYAAIAAVVLLIGSGWYVHHQGYESGRAAGDALAKAAVDRQHDAEQDTATLAASLRQVTAETDRAKADADAAAKRAQSAVAETQAVKEQADRDAAAFAKQLDAATNQPECHVLKEQLCTSAMGY